MFLGLRLVHVLLHVVRVFVNADVSALPATMLIVQENRQKPSRVFCPNVICGQVSKQILLNLLYIEHFRTSLNFRMDCVEASFNKQLFTTITWFLADVQQPVPVVNNREYERAEMVENVMGKRKRRENVLKCVVLNHQQGVNFWQFYFQNFTIPW